MKCPHCRREWKTEPQSDAPVFCPFCDEILDHKKAKPQKEPFFYTWGLIHEEDLKKNSRNPKIQDFEAALDNYLEAVGERKDLSVKPADLATDYPQFSEVANRLIPLGKDMNNLDELTDSEKRITGLYKQALENGNGQAAGKLGRFIRAHSVDDKAALNALNQLIYSDSSWMKNPGLYSGLNALCALMQNNYSLAVSEYKKMLNAEDSVFTALSPSLFYELSGLPARFENRKKYIEKAFEAGNVCSLIQGLCRPLVQEDRKFDQLNLLDRPILDFFNENSEETVSVIRQMIETENSLSGLHLLLQQCSRMDPDLDELFKPLLELHYQKVYMKPYSWISQTDYVLDPKFLDRQ